MRYPTLMMRRGRARQPSRTFAARGSLYRYRPFGASSRTRKQLNVADVYNDWFSVYRKPLATAPGLGLDCSACGDS